MVGQRCKISLAEEQMSNVLWDLVIKVTGVFLGFALECTQTHSETTRSSK